MLQDALLFFAGALGAILNAVVGGGSFITFPALLAAGVPAVQASASSTFVLWPAVAASTLAYWRELTVPKRLFVALAVTSLAGGIAGALLLLHIPSSNFVRLVPWLLLVATLIFSLGRRVVESAGERVDERGAGALALAFFLQLAIAVYGGFFGGGMGIMMLAAWSLLGMKGLHGMNALRLVLSVMINGAAIVPFLAHRSIAWRPALVMVLGAVIGGYAGARYARQLSPRWLGRLVVVIAWAMTGYFFLTITLAWR